MIEQVKFSIDNAQQMRSKLPVDTISIEGGYSGKMGRHLLNNLAGLFQPYVEVGCYTGSTLISAAYGNSGLVVGVDNFSDETKPGHYMLETRRTLLQNMAEYSDRARPSLIDAACWNVQLTGVKCCFFDGGHSEQDHVFSVALLCDWFCPQFVFVVDDFNRQNVRDGTRRGIAERRLRIDYELWLGADAYEDREGWWNGFGVYVLSK